jgi:2-polyprenyl-3-methyl-5-hydroxy-6-metoxy-1,4-benzoquinol methylase
MDESRPHPYEFDERPEVISCVPPSDRLLDVGCSTGGFAHGLRKAGVKVREIWGIEPNPDAAKIAKRHLDKTIVGLYPDDVPAGEQFDVIVFNDVLEHMLDPWATLRMTHSLLRTGGIVIASIPNVRYWPVVRDLVLRGDWTYTETGTLDRTHLRFFTRKTTHELFSATGYEVTQIEPGFMLKPRRLHMALNLLPRDMRMLQYVVVARQHR